MLLFMMLCERVSNPDVLIYRMFMYIFLGGLVFLMLFGMYQILESRTVSTFLFSDVCDQQCVRAEHTLYLSAYNS